MWLEWFDGLVLYSDAMLTPLAPNTNDQLFFIPHEDQKGEDGLQIYLEPSPISSNLRVPSSTLLYLPTLASMLEAFCILRLHL